MRKECSIGVIGYGGMACYHHLRIPKPEEVRFISACDISDTRLKAAEKNGLKTYASLEKFLGDKELDAVLVAVPNNLHKELAIRAMNARKHVICEKPVALNSDELNEMLECAGKNRVLFTVHHNRRMDEDFQIIKKVYDENLIGDIFRIESRVQGSRGIADTWRRRKECGGGMLYDWGVHLIDQILYMLPGRVVSVCAEFQYINQKEVDDNVRLTMVFDTGESVLVEIGTCNYGMLPIWYVCGKKGTVQIDYWNLEGRMYRLVNENIAFEDEIPSTLVGPSITLAPRAADTMEILPLPKAEVDKGFFYTNFYKAFKGEVELIVRPQEVRRSMAVIDLVFRSGKEKRVLPCCI